MWYKKDDGDRVWWKDNNDQEGNFIFSFDKRTEYNLFRDYPQKLSKRQKQIFDAENPYWAEFFKDRSE